MYVNINLYIYIHITYHRSGILMLLIFLNLETVKWYVLFVYPLPTFQVPVPGTHWRPGVRIIRTFVPSNDSCHGRSFLVPVQPPSRRFGQKSLEKYKEETHGHRKASCFVWL